MSETTDLIANLPIANENIVRHDSAVNDAPGTWVTRHGVVVDNLRKRLEAMGFQNPIPYEADLAVSDTTTTVVVDGRTYYPNPAEIPFTTTVGFDPDQWLRFGFLEEAEDRVIAAAASEASATASATDAATSAASAAADRASVAALAASTPADYVVATYADLPGSPSTDDVALILADENAGGLATFRVYDGADWGDPVYIDPSFSSVSDMLAAPGSFPVDTIITGGGYRYEVAASGATDHHLTTADGVKLYVLRGAGGYDVRAFGASLNGSDDDTPMINLAIAAAHADGGGEVYAPSGGTVRLTPQGTIGSIGGSGSATHNYMLNLKDVDNVSIRFDSDVVIDYGTTRSDAFYLEDANRISIHPFRYTVNGSGTTCDIVQAINTARVFFWGSHCIGGTGEIEGLVTSQTSSEHWFLWDHYLGTECDWTAGIAFYDFVQNIHISRNHFEGGTAFYPIDLEREAVGSGQVYITENNINGCKAAGIKAVALDGLIIANNQTRDMTLPDVSAGYNGEANGIEVLDCENYVVSNNISLGNAAAGIRIKRGSKGLIAGNFTDGNTDGGVYFDPTSSGGTITDVTLAADNEFRDGVAYTRHDKLLNVKDMRPDANHRWFDVGHMIDFGGVENPLFGKSGTPWSREARAHPYGNTSLKYSPTGHAGFDRLTMSIPDEYWTPFQGKTVQITLNYEMADAAYTGSARLRLTDGVNDYNINLPVQTEPKDFTFSLEIDASATAVDLTLYGTFTTAPSHDLFFNHLTVGAAIGQADQKKFASAIPTITLANGEIVYDPTATASPFAWIMGGGAWRVMT